MLLWSIVRKFFPELTADKMIHMDYTNSYVLETCIFVLTSKIFTDKYWNC